MWEGCGGIPKYVLPYEFKVPGKSAEFINNYSPYLKGKKFFLDPGHGGNDRKNKGFLGNTVEADVNLSVALAVKNYLVEAGAVVLLSRDKDTSVDLKDRSLLANKSKADFFLSIHHNAPGEKEDIWTNYTSTYYHSKEKENGFEPCQRDLAKYIQRDLSYAMRNSGGSGSFDGTYSDYDIYPGQGFSVLRLTKIPAVLIECGFTTSEYESGLINQKEFNNIEAWGIFKGICRYLSNGIPEIKYIKEETFGPKDSLNILFSIKDSVGINPKSIELYVDSLHYDSYNLNKNGDVLSVHYPAANYGKHSVRIITANKKGNYALPFSCYIFIPNN